MTNGSKPNIAQLAVINFGRTRPMLACRSASSKDIPSLKSARVYTVKELKISAHHGPQ
jgi:hypothetical protein